jgi:signal transduction histidine kinase
LDSTANAQLSETLDRKIGETAIFRRMHQELFNLLSNVRHFTSSGGKVSISVAPDGSDIVFYVTDSGVGIALENR